MSDDVITRDENGDLAVRTVSATEAESTSQYDDLYARTTDGKRALRVVGGDGGGEYLPLSGGILTGTLTVTGNHRSRPNIIFNDTSGKPQALLFLKDEAILIESVQSLLAGTYVFGFGGSVLGPTSFYPANFKYGVTLGNPLGKWANIYAHKINNGMDISVPATSGTMVVATPPTAAGNYVLKAIVAEDGTMTTEWVTE